MLTTEERERLEQIAADTEAWATFHEDILWLIALVRRLDAECQRLRAGMVDWHNPTKEARK
jgi:hypothetical protein